jgi:hypothetical protein
MAGFSEIEKAFSLQLMLRSTGLEMANHIIVDNRLRMLQL